MANLIGLCRVSVTNIFLKMTNQGIIEKEKGYLVIKSLDKLTTCVNKSNPSDDDFNEICL